MTTRRRRFSYSLRTFFVVLTVPMVLLGWIVNQRTWLERRREVAGEPIFYDLGNRPDPEAPWPLNWLGEHGQQAIRLRKGTPEAEVSRLRKLFPEADVAAWP